MGQSIHAFLGHHAQPTGGGHRETKHRELWVALGFIRPKLEQHFPSREENLPLLHDDVSQIPGSGLSHSAFFALEKMLYVLWMSYFPLLYKILSLWKVSLIAPFFILGSPAVISDFASQTTGLRGKKMNNMIGKNNSPIRFMEFHFPQRVLSGGGMW